jgi:hypothetical protein
MISNSDITKKKSSVEEPSSRRAVQLVKVGIVPANDEDPPRDVNLKKVLRKKDSQF